MVLGLTGFSGTGKSTVAAYLAEKGFYHIDCDRLVHQEVYRDQAVLSSIAAAFGEKMVENGQLNRAALRQITFGDPAATARLNQVVMPHILAAIEGALEAHKGEPVVLDAPLLFEYGLEKKCDRTISVIAAEETAVHRIMARDHLSEADARKRLSSQHPAAYYAAKSDFLIENDQDAEQLKKRIREVLSAIYD